MKNVIKKRHNKINIAEPLVTEDAIISVASTLRTRWIGQADKVDQFEKDIEKKFKLKSGSVSTVNSGTSALELAYDLLGLKENSEVITTPFTCTATNIPLLRRGVKIIFADIRRDTMNIDPIDVERKITKDTKAIINVHIGGIESKIPYFGVPVVNDAAHAFGFFSGDYTACSFQAIKHITTGDGGVLYCDSLIDSNKTKLLRWFGIDRKKKKENAWKAYKNREMLYDVEYLGYKYHMNDIAASLGIEHLKKYDEIIEYRKKIFDIYKNYGVPLLDGARNLYWLATLLIDNRECFAEFMHSKNIETNMMHVRNDEYKIFKKFKVPLQNMDWMEDKYICIPIHNKMSLDDAEYIGESVREYFKIYGNSLNT